MTGGVVAVLGPTGRNFGAGMTNGFAYVLDEDGSFAAKVNDDSVLLEPVAGIEDSSEFRTLVERHVEMTGSAHGKRLLENWESVLTSTWKVIPRARLELERELEEAAQTQGVAD
jgi:glutamate synthase domain-containing protein 3